MKHTDQTTALREFVDALRETIGLAPIHKPTRVFRRAEYMPGNLPGGNHQQRARRPSP